MQHKVRIGAVNYLNTKPLICDLTELAPDADLILEPPSLLADMLAAGKLDVALIPAIEYFRAGSYSIIPDISIATRGPVLSVTLFSRVPCSAIRRLALDVGSRTSAALTQILLRKRYQARPELQMLSWEQKPEDLDVDAVLLIGINRPEVQNRIEVPTFLALGHAYWQLDHDEALRVAVLFAHGSDFSPGLDPLSWANGLRAQVFAGPISEFVNPVGTSKPYRQKPLVAAVHGKTQLLGHELFLAADIRVAASDSRFAQAEVARGVYPGGGGTVRFAREAGWGNAMRYMLTGDEWGADEARRMGLVQEVTEPGRELDRALEIAGKIAANAPMGVRAVLASAHQGRGRRRGTGCDLSEFARLMQSETAEFARALQEKRAPVYRGR